MDPKPLRRNDEFALIFVIVFVILYPLFFIAPAFAAGAWSSHLTLADNALNAFAFLVHLACYGVDMPISGYFLNVKPISHWPDFLFKRLTSIEYVMLPISFIFSFFAALFATEPPDRLQVVDGRRITRDPKIIAKQLRKIEKANGLFLHPQVRISKALEASHFMLLGQSGSGKSSVLKYLMSQAMSRKGARTLIFDYKGDFTAATPDEVALLSPWDARSWAWDVSIDCINPSQAQTLAQGLIPDAGDNPFWANGARAILTGIIVHQQKTRGTDWNFEHLAKAITAPLEDIQAIINESYPRANKYLLDDSDTTQSLEATLSSFSGPIFDLADAFGRHPAEKRISISLWLTNPPAHYPMTIILGGNLNYIPLMKGLVQGVFRVIQQTVGSPSMRNIDNEVFIFIDEFLQLDRLEMLMPLLEVARSKGVRLFLAGQDLARINDVYSRDKAQAIMGTLGTKIFFKSSGPSTQDYSDLIGYQDVKEYGLTTNLSLNQSGGGQAHSWNRIRIPAFDAHRFGTDIGIVKNVGVRAIVFTGDKQVGLLGWPFCTKEQWKENQREDLIEADWLSANYPHSEDEFQLMLAERRAAAEAEEAAEAAEKAKSSTKSGTWDAFVRVIPAVQPVVIDDTKPLLQDHIQIKEPVQHPIFSEKGADMDDQAGLAKDAYELSNDGSEAAEALDAGDLSGAIDPGLSIIVKAIDILDSLGSHAKQTGTVTESNDRDLDDEKARKLKRKIKR